MMKAWPCALMALALSAVAAGAMASDFETLRYLKASPATVVAPLPSGSTPRPVEFARLVFQVDSARPWGMIYESISPGANEGLTPYELLTWNGRFDGETAAFAHTFNEEVNKAGFGAAHPASVFDEGGGAALKVGVTIDDVKARFCIDCPNMFNTKGVPATVLMTARWEIYSSLERKVLARITTSGGAEYQGRLGSNALPPMLDGFRENVRQLLASEEFRRVVTTTPTTASTSAAASPTTVTLVRSKAPPSLADASKAVAIVYAADGRGSGFLISTDGYLLTYQHVVGESKYVKLKWSNGVETLGEVLRTNARRDVALIKSAAPGRSPLALRPGPIRQGEAVYAIGTPLDDSLQNTMTRGIISAERVEDGQRLIQSDAGINHGNSGGPLLDEKGAVVGVAVSGILPDSRQMGLNFFIPIDDALAALAVKPGG